MVDSKKLRDLNRELAWYDGSFMEKKIQRFQGTQPTELAMKLKEYNTALGAFREVNKILAMMVRIEIEDEEKKLLKKAKKIKKVKP